MTRQTALLIGGVVFLVAATAGASALITQKSMESDASAVHKTASVKNETITWNDRQPAPAPAAQDCNDHNVVGKIGGGVVGGIVGSKVGKGDGKTAGTIAGTLGGSYLGGKFEPTQNITCK
jgi:outer membrane lipoprotein SlyB